MFMLCYAFPYLSYFFIPNDTILSLEWMITSCHTYFFEIHPYSGRKMRQLVARAGSSHGHALSRAGARRAERCADVSQIL